MGKGFGTGKSNWNSSIWGDSNLGGGFADGELLSGTLKAVFYVLTTSADQHIGDSTFEGKSGSGSLLSMSESDSWNGCPNVPWSTVNASLSMGQNKTVATSPIQTRSTQALNESGEGSYFALPRTTGMGTSASTVSHRPYMNSASEGVSPTGDGVSFSGFPGLRNGDGRRQMNSTGLSGSPVGTSFPVNPGFSGPLDGARPDEMASMGMSSLGSAMPERVSPSRTRNSLSHMSHNSASYAQRPVHSSQPSFYSDTNSVDGRYGRSSIDLSSGFNKLHLNDGGFSTQSSVQRPSYIPHASFDGSLTRAKLHNNDEPGIQPLSSHGEGAANIHLAYQGRSRALDSGSIPPSDYPRMDSPLYSGIEGQYRDTGSRMLDSQAVAFERRLRNLQEQDFAQVQGGSLQRMQIPPAYDYSGFQAARLSALQGFYPMAHLGGLGATALVGRTHREHDPTQVVRSPLLEEFRANSKGNKRYELKVRPYGKRVTLGLH